MGSVSLEASNGTVCRRRNGVAAMERQGVSGQRGHIGVNPLRPRGGALGAQEMAQHIHVLELRAVYLALRKFLPYLRGRHVLVRCDKSAVYHVNYFILSSTFNC